MKNWPWGTVQPESPPSRNPPAVALAVAGALAAALAGRYDPPRGGPDRGTPPRLFRLLGLPSCPRITAAVARGGTVAVFASPTLPRPATPGMLKGVSWTATAATALAGVLAGCPVNGPGGWGRSYARTSRVHLRPVLVELGRRLVPGPGGLYVPTEPELTDVDCRHRRVGWPPRSRPDPHAGRLRGRSEGVAAAEEDERGRPGRWLGFDVPAHGRSRSRDRRRAGGAPPCTPGRRARPSSRGTAGRFRAGAGPRPRAAASPPPGRKVGGQLPLRRPRARFTTKCAVPLGWPRKRHACRGSEADQDERRVGGDRRG